MSPSGEPMNSTLLVVDSEEGSSAYSSEGNNDNGSVESNSNTPPGKFQIEQSKSITLC